MFFYIPPLAFMLQMSYVLPPHRWNTSKDNVVIFASVLSILKNVRRKQSFLKKIKMIFRAFLGSKAKLRGSYKASPYTSWPYTHTASLTINIPTRMGLLLLFMNLH